MNWASPEKLAFGRMREPLGRQKPGLRALALFGSDGGKGCYQLVNPLAATAWARHLSFLHVGDMKMLGELLLAVVADKNVFRHGNSPANIIRLPEQ
jgi:hypothetical protein